MYWRIRKRFNYGGGSCMICNTIFMEVRMEPLFIAEVGRGRNRESLTAARYIEYILADYAEQCESTYRNNCLGVFYRCRFSMEWSLPKSHRTFVGRAQRKSSSQTS